MNVSTLQPSLFSDVRPEPEPGATTTFVDNMKLPVHRWFRFSAGFSAQWAETTIAAMGAKTVLDPFAGSGTTLLAAERQGAHSFGVEAHTFVARIAKAKLQHRTDSDEFLEQALAIRRKAAELPGDVSGYPPLIQKCFGEVSLRSLDSLRQAWQLLSDDSPASQLAWLALVGVLRRVSHVGTAPWQYVLPQKRKRSPAEAIAAFESMARTMVADMRLSRGESGPKPMLIQGDARDCVGVPDGVVDAVITSPPYPNNYDYADATRLEMCFMGEIAGWGDLHEAVRKHLITSCSQHWSERTLDIETALGRSTLAPIQAEIEGVCGELGRVRLDKGGRKNYHLMVASYFADIGQVWQALRRVCRPGCQICFVIGDSAPYGVYVPVVEWTSALAEAAGFSVVRFDKMRDRNIKWKNRKHRVPLCEGQLWVNG
ncbi:MAG: DNA methyltransferase [Vicinamibacterales bacterium]